MKIISLTFTKTVLRSLKQYYINEDVVTKH